jgi:hypothetical protein
MKKIFLFLALLAAAETNAQKLTAGLRGGASYWMEAGDKGYRPQAMQGHHISPDIEGFVRRTSGKWAFEGAVGASALQYKLVDGYTFIECPTGMTDFSTDVRNMDLTLTAQRDITCPAMKSCPLFSRVHNYIGVTIGGAATRTTDRYSYEGGTSNMSITYFQLWTGLSNTITVDLCKKVQLVSTGFVRIAPTEFFSTFHPRFDGFNPVARAGVQLGGAYRF